LSSERPGSIIIKGIHPSKVRPSTAKAKFSKQIIYADMNLAAVPRPCAFPQLQVQASTAAQTCSSDECHSLLFLQFLNGAALTVDIFDLAALSEVHVCGRQYFVSSSTHCAT
jgi:hypothetical protein